MAEVSFLHLPEDDHDLFLEEISAFDSFPYWPHHHPTCVFDLEDDLSVSIGNENGVVSSSERKNQVNFVMDLLHQRVEESNLMGTRENGSNTINESTFRVTEDNYDVGRVELGLGLGLINQENDNDNDNNNNNNNNNNNVVIEDDEDYNFGGFAVSDCGDDFYIAKRRENENENECRNCSNARSSRITGLRAVWIESDSDSEVEVEVEGIDNGLLAVHDEEEDFGVENVNDDDDDDALSVPIRWESLILDVGEEEEVNRDFEWEEDHAEVVRDFEWEEVDGGIDEREVLSLLADPEDEEEEGSISVLNFSGLEEDGERGRRLSNLDWEVLLNVDNLDSNPELENEAEPYFGDHDDYIYTAEYEMMFGQFADVENAGMGRPPASKAVVKELPSVIITKEDVADEKALCAVCKDQIEVGEEGKQLPCSHRYHGDCIIPWLGIRNTCPVCRFELPTDDPDYEQRRLRIATRVAS